MDKARQTIVNIQVLRFVAALWVVLYHSRFFVSAQASFMVPPQFLRLLESVGFMGVDIFFVISGAIMALTSGRLLPHWRNSLHFTVARFARVYSGWWPLFACYWVGGLWWQGTALEGKWFFSSLLLLPVRLDHYVVSVIWTLSFELYFYCLVALLVLLPCAWRGRAFTAALLCLLVFCAWSWGKDYYTPAREAESWPWQGFLGFPLLGEFIVGFLAFEWVRRRGLRRAWPWFAASLVFLMLALWWETQLARPSGISLEGFFGVIARALLVGSFALTLVVGALVARPVSGWAGRMLSRFGDASYAIYLSHILVLFVTSKVLQALHWPAHWYGPTLLVLLVAVLVFSLAYYQLIEYPVYRAVRRTVDAAIRRKVACIKGC